ncbi:MAG: trypsin-like peptidase domain-containing protein [Sandaracinaceae bacterium]|nr:trypsin-like peptidase domain-containing protein [Sandaracinaceae bacterium]
MTTRRRAWPLFLWAVAFFVMGAGTASLAHLAWPTNGAGQPPPAPPDFPSSPPPAQLVTPRGSLSEAEQSTIELFDGAAPSVVFITRVTVRTDPFRRRVLEIPEGSGSGFVWDRQGHIVTNFHVIEGGSGARVTLSDGSTWPAELAGAVAEKDIAVLRIDAPEELLTPLPIGSSHDLRVGQSVFAIGNPFGLDHTLSAGVVSGLEREIMSIGQRPIQGVIQTDAAINPGNSGGPLLDSAGRLVGINTMIYSPSGASAGIGFAVPVDTVARAVPQLIEHGRVIRPGLGLSLADPQLVARLGLRGGSLVLGVEPGSPAEAAGIRPTLQDRVGRLRLGDIVVTIDGQEVSEPNDIYRQLDRHEVGDTVQVGLVRGGERVEVPIQLVAVAAR